MPSWKAQFLEAGRARLAGDRPDQGVSLLERENDRLKRIWRRKNWSGMSREQCGGSEDD
ncbi:hypothetical protein M1R55_23880 (plasmid) [Deinococcus sp. QL22]|nr:hypothetical protein [Deinococcus sp. QL22]UQN09524.1 hypothetical protein M1R55_23880 [Deinococcus sp. QL22]